MKVRAGEFIKTNSVEVETIPVMRERV